MESLEKIVDIHSGGKSFRSIDGKEWRCIYLAQHKVESWWEDEVGSLAGVIQEVKDTTTIGAGLQAEVTLGQIAMSLGLPSGRISAHASLEKEHITSTIVKHNLSSYIKALILERHHLKKGFFQDWVNAKAGHLLRWQGIAEITELKHRDEAHQLYSTSAQNSALAYVGMPNALPPWINSPDLAYTVNVKIEHYGDQHPYLIWFSRPGHNALIIMDRSFTTDLHRYVSSPDKQIVFVGEAIEWAGNVRFLNPYIVWMLL